MVQLQGLFFFFARAVRIHSHGVMFLKEEMLQCIADDRHLLYT